MAQDIIVRLLLEGKEKYNKDLQDINENLNKISKDGGNSLVKYSLELKKAIDTIVKQMEVLTKEGKQNTNEYKKLSDELTDKLDAINSLVEVSTGAYQNYKKQIQELTKETIRLYETQEALKASGKENTETYATLTLKIKENEEAIGELKDKAGDFAEKTKNLGSDTRGLDRLIRTTQLGVNAFGAFEGATQLFGAESEQLSKTIAKLNAIMVIQNSLQQLQDELKKEDTVVTGVQTLAQKAYTVAVGGSTGAVKLLRLALIATGIGAFIVLIGVLIANFDKVKQAVASAIDKFNNLGSNVKIIFTILFPFVRVWIELYNAIQQVSVKFGDFKGLLSSIGVFIKTLLGDIGVAIGKLLVLDFSGATTAIKDGVKKATIEGQKEANRNIVRVKIGADLTTLNKDLLKLQASGASELTISKKELSIKQTELKQIANNGSGADSDEFLKKQAEVVEAQRKVNGELENLQGQRVQKQKENADRIKEIQAKQLQDNKDLLNKEIIELTSAYNSLNATDSNRFELKKAIISKRLELDNLEATSSEQKALNLQLANQQILDLENEFKDKLSDIIAETTRLRIENGVDDDLLEASLLAQENYNQRLIEIEKTRQDNLKQNAESGGGEAGINAITNLADEQQKKAKKELTDALIKIDLDYYEREKNNIEKNADDKLTRIQVDYIQEQSALIIARDKELALAEGKGKEKLKIEQKYQDLIKESSDKFAIEQLTATKAVINEQINALNTAIDSARKQGASDEQINGLIGQQNKLKAEIVKIEGAITKEKSEQATQRNENESDQNNQRIKEIVNTISTVGELENQAFDIYKQLSEQQTETRRAEYDKDLQNLSSQKEQGLINETQYQARKAVLDEKYRKEEAKAKRKQAIADKAQAIFNATLQGAVATIRAFADGGPILAAIVGALTAAQIALIASRPIPAFAKGSKFVQRGLNPSGIDTIPAYLNEGEAVVPTDKNAKFSKAVSSIIDGNFNDKFQLKQPNLNRALYNITYGKDIDLSELRSEMQTMNKNLKVQIERMDYAEMQRNLQIKKLNNNGTGVFL